MCFFPFSEAFLAQSAAVNIGHIHSGLVVALRRRCRSPGDGTGTRGVPSAVSPLVYTHTHTHHGAINTATAILIFNCVDGLHLCCSVMQTLLYILSGLIVIRAENLIKLNNKGDRSSFSSADPFFPLAGF